MNNITPPTSPSSVFSHSSITYASDPPVLVSWTLTNIPQIGETSLLLPNHLIEPWYSSSLQFLQSLVELDHHFFLLFTPKCLPHSNQLLWATFLFHLIFQINPTSPDVSPTFQSHPEPLFGYNAAIGPPTLFMGINHVCVWQLEKASELESKWCDCHSDLNLCLTAFRLSRTLSLDSVHGL